MWRCQIHHESVVIRDGQPALVDVLKSSRATFWSWVSVTSFPADVRLLQVYRLKSAESVLTGESLPVNKRTDATVAGTPLADLTGCALMGTVARAGGGSGVEVATSARTEADGLRVQCVAEGPPTPATPATTRDGGRDMSRETHRDANLIGRAATADPCSGRKNRRHVGEMLASVGAEASTGAVQNRDHANTSLTKCVAPDRTRPDGTTRTRRAWDLNPREACAPSGFQVRPRLVQVVPSGAGTCCDVRFRPSSRPSGAALCRFMLGRSLASCEHGGCFGGAPCLTSRTTRTTLPQVF